MHTDRRLEALLDELGFVLDRSRASFTGADPVLACRYPLGESAAAVMAAAGLAAARLGGVEQDVHVDVRHAAAHLRGFLDQREDGAVLEPDPTGRLVGVGMHAARDGWVQTYGGFAPLDERTYAVLGLEGEPSREAVADAVAGREAGELVDALLAAGAPGALVQTAEDWEASAAGRAVRAEPVVLVERIGDAAPGAPHARRDVSRGAREPRRLLAGLRVLDLSRVLAGPTCARTLAEHGADVLLLTAPKLHAVRRALLDTSPGKRMAELDLGEDRDTLDGLLETTDVVCANARPGSFAKRGLAPEQLAERFPGIVAVTMDGYGDRSPWRARPGFEHLAQASAGWADEHRDAEGRPTILPALPCDYLTGYLAALGTLEALHRQRTEGGSWRVHASLVRTAMWLRDQPGRHDPGAVDPDGLRADRTLDLRTPVETYRGRIDQLRPAAQLSVTPTGWDAAPRARGSDPPAWW